MTTIPQQIITHTPKAQASQEIINKEIACLEQDLKNIFEILPISISGFTKESKFWNIPKVIGNVALILREPLLVLTILIALWLAILFVNAYISGKIMELKNISIASREFVALAIFIILFVALIIWLTFISMRIYSSTRFKTKDMLIKSSKYLNTLSKLSTLTLFSPQNSYQYAKRILEIEKSEVESNDKKMLRMLSLLAFSALYHYSIFHSLLS
jgi:hypothetical protein